MAAVKGVTREKFALRIDRLQAAREAKGWSQRELARLCGLGEGQISKYEKGENDPSATVLKTIAQHLDLSTDYLVGLSDEAQGQVRGGELTTEERHMVDVFRRQGWAGVVHLGADKLKAT